MPTVPLYQDTQQRVALRPEYSENFTTRADADAFGAGVGRGMQALGKGMETAATNLNEAALRLKKLDDKTAAKEAQTKFSNWKRNALHGTGGFLSLSGKEAIAAGPEVVKQSQKARDDFGKDLSPDARTQYEQQTQDDQTDVEKTSIDHSMDARRENVQEVYNDRVRSLTDDIVVNFGNREKEAQSREFLDNEIEDNGILNNKSPEEIDNDKQRIHFDLNRQIAEDLATKDPIGIHKIISENPGFLRDDDRIQLQPMLDNLALNARVLKNVTEITGSLVPHDYSAGSGPFMKLLDPKAGPTIAKAGGLDFAKTASSPKSDLPPVKWATGVTNSVLSMRGSIGADGISANSFRYFGVETSNPRNGDIVVVSGKDGEPRVGLFQGHDAQGNILMLSGDEPPEESEHFLVKAKYANAPERVSLKVQSPETLLAYRTNPDVSDEMTEIPNNSLVGLGFIEKKINAIEDPNERELTQKGVEMHFAAQKKEIDGKRRNVVNQQYEIIKSDKTYNPLEMPRELQQLIRPSDMAMLIEYAAKQARGDSIKTDQVRLYTVQDMFASDPEQFRNVNLNQYILLFSEEHFTNLQKMQELSRTNPKKAKQQARELKRAFELAIFELEGAARYYQPHGITKGRDGELKDIKFANFQNDLATEIETFREQNKDRPLTDADVRDMIGKLTFRHYHMEKPPTDPIKTGIRSRTFLSDFLMTEENDWLL